MLKIEIKNLTGKKIPPARLLRKTVRTTLRRLGESAEGELNLVFVSDKLIRKLNLKYKRKDLPTDVLAFSMAEGRHLKGASRLWGDIVVSVDRAKRAAREFGSSQNKETCLYVIHGVLHLLGFGDNTKREFKLMQATQQKILKAVLKHRWAQIEKHR